MTFDILIGLLTLTVPFKSPPLFPVCPSLPLMRGNPGQFVNW